MKHLYLQNGLQLITHRVLDSTNLEAKRLITTHRPKKGFIIQAQIQTSGRGRGARVWSSLSGNLHFSIVLQSKILYKQLTLISLVSSIGVLEGIASLVPLSRVELSCKWPNDILYRGKKICGILLESGLSSRNIVWIIIGIGINVTTFPDITHYPATALATEGISIPCADIFLSVCNQVEIWLECWKREGFSVIRRVWLTMAEGTKKEVLMRFGDFIDLGKILDLEKDGTLLVRRACGNTQRITSRFL